MAVSIKEITGLSSFKNSHIIAGKAGLGNAIDNLHILEITDILVNIPSGTLIFSTLYPILNNEAQVNNIMERFSEMGVGGLALKLNRQGERVPQDIIDAADRYAIPIVLLPSGGNFSMQANEILEYQLETNLHELRERDRIHNLLLDIMLNRQDYDVLRDTLANVTGYGVALYSEELVPLVAGGDAPDLSALPGREKSLLARGVGEAFRMLQQGGQHLCIYTMKDQKATIGYIALVHCEEFAPSAFEKLTVETFATAFAIIYHRKKALTEVERRYRDEFLFDMVSGKILSITDAMSRARRLGLHAAWPATMVGVSAQPKDRAHISAALENVWADLPAVSHRDSFFLASYEGNTIAIMPSKYIPAFAEAWGRAAEDGCRTGISQDIDSFDGVAQAYDEVKLSLRVAQDLHADTPISYSKLGIYRLIHATENREAIYRYCMDTIGALLAYDKKHKTELYTTLKSIIDADGNFKLAASRMYIHYNTIRGRVKRIEQLLGIEFAKLSSYQEVYIAVKIYEVFPR